MKKSWFQCRLRWFLGKELYAKASWLENWAAALSFYNLLCQVPLFIVVITLAGTFLSQESAASIRDVLIRLLPINSKNSSDEVLQGLRQVSGGGFMTVAFAAAIWTSANFMNQMLKALHFVMGGTWDAWAGAWNRRLKSFLLLLIWITKMFFTAAAILFLPVLSNELVRSGAPSFFVTPLAVLLYQILHLALTFATFYLTYKLASTKPIPHFLLCQAALLASVGWVAVRSTFLHLLPLAWNVGFLAGTITSMLALLLLAYCVAWVILLGACWIARDPKFSGSPREAA